MKRQQGLTLTEIMIAMLLGLIVLLAVSALLTDLLRSQTRDRLRATLNGMGDAAMSTMAMDLRRAGYRGSDTSANAPYADIHIEEQGTCLRYAYAPPPGDTQMAHHFFALRLKDGSLQQLASTQANWRCDAPDALWQNLTLPAQAKVETLQFLPIGETGHRGIRIRLSMQDSRRQLPPANWDVAIALRNQPEITP